MFRRIVPALLAGMLLAGCDTQFATSTRELMRPPALTAQQKEIRDALALAVGDGNIKYKYPQNGSYHSSFILQDLDGDQQEEALVFYQSPSKGDHTWMSVLDQLEGRWVSVCETSSPDVDASVDFIRFENLTQDGRPDIVVGWADNRQNKTVYLYGYRDGRLENLFDKEYTALSITDLDGNGQLDLVLLTLEYHFTQVFLATRSPGEEGGPEEFGIVSSAQLERQADGFAQVTAGKVDGVTNALFLDQNVDQQQVTDVISAVTTGGSTNLVNLLDNDQAALSHQTLRPQEDIFCQDINGDGLVEIPTMTYLPGYDEEDEGENIYLTSFNQLAAQGSSPGQDSPAQLVPVRSGVVNSSHRYMVTFPQRWLEGQVTVVSQPENGEWTFLPYSQEGSPTLVPLLRIRVYSTKDYRDKFESGYFQLLTTKGLFEYYAYIPNTTSPLSITQEELEEMVTFLNR